MNAEERKDLTDLIAEFPKTFTYDQFKASMAQRGVNIDECPEEIREQLRNAFASNSATNWDEEKI